MIAIATNLIVRYLTGDDPSQSAQGRKLIDGEDVFVPVTVLLQTEWVLRGVYGNTVPQVAGALRSFAGLPHVTVEDARLAAQALDWMEAGMDFAGALHLTRAAACDAFVSFDRRMARAANRVANVKVRAP